ncbi:MAG: hypothetical protein JWN79_392 [Gemmatimonadetes bacterium]|jgi:hypothetical protein|nr:hypothetical protein [Gemmatimonadota bacterium]
MRIAADVLVAPLWMPAEQGRRAVTACRVRERPPRYEDEGSVRESRGAVSLPGGAWWAASLSAPLGHGTAGDADVRVRLGRHGAGRSDALEAASVDLLVSADELDAVVALLAGIVGQARRDGVLP